jgi:hypothetical protein
MDEFIKMDIFFAVTTVAVVVVAAAILFVLWRIDRVLQHVEHISVQVSRESDALRADLSELRANVRKGALIGGVVTFFKRFIKRTRKKS